MRKYNKFDIVHPQDDNLRLVGVGEYNDQYSLIYHRYMVECLHCGEYFLTHRPHSKYCSCACKQAAYRARRDGEE